MKELIIAVTGASGSMYAKKLIENISSEIKIHLILSKSATSVIPTEIINWNEILNRKNIISHSSDNLFSCISSGSYQVEDMVIVPCSVKTLSSIANGYTDNLISRAADVMIKERRNLVMVVRETPLSAIHSENMLKLSRLGVCMLPAMPAFYHHPKTIDDLADFMVTKILDQLKIKSNLIKRWGHHD